MVSIITPCFNLESYITQTYQSLKRQTHAEWEWIVVDDESTDGTVDRIREFNDPRIKLILSKHYGNLSILRNLGAREASGDILSFVDGDDILMANKLQAQVDLFRKHPRMGWSHTNACTLIDETNALEPRKMPDPPGDELLAAEDAFSSLARRNYIYISSVMVRRDVFFSIGGFKERLNRCEDIDLWLRLAAHGFDLGYCEEPLLQYRIRASGLFNSKTLEYLKMNFVVYDDLRIEFPELSQKYQEVISRYRSDNYLKIGIQKLLQGKDNPRAEFDAAFAHHGTFKKFLWKLGVFVSKDMMRRYIRGRKHFN
jgi:glycosyltransferase involved in cell wall biosynthesis